MNREQARAEMKRLLGDAASLLSVADEDAALDAARVPDFVGRAPGEVGYVETFDGWAAAAEAADLLAIRALGMSGRLESFSSEGASFQWKAADFSAMAAAIRAKMSGRSAGMSVISIDTGRPGEHGVGGDGYWTWDGDVPRWYPWKLPC